MLLQARAREAAEQSRRILEEEKAKDAAWREAVKMVCLLALAVVLLNPHNCAGGYTYSKPHAVAPFQGEEAALTGPSH